jgi:membrane protease YdiL (CAAX protease family)
MTTATLDRRPDHARFGATFACALLIGALIAAAIAPPVADLLARAGLRFPFTRIFDRVAMVTLAGTLFLFARRLRLQELLIEGFREPRANLSRFCVGFGVAASLMALLAAIAIALAHRAPPPIALALRALSFVPAALVIALIEEAFFRVILLGGLARDSRRGAALLISAAIYAAAHLVRGPRHYYLDGFHPAAGFSNLAASLTPIVWPGDLLAMTFGLFLLGIVLGEAFRATGRVYFPIGLHAGFVIGAKCWPLIADAFTPPRWLAGPGPVPLIAAPAAWLVALALFGWMRLRPLERSRSNHPRGAQVS